MSQIDAVMGVIRALSGGEVEEREIVRVARRLHGSGISPVAVTDALVTAMERAAAHLEATGGRGRSLGLAAAALFGGGGAAAGLNALGAALPSFSRLFALVPLIGVGLIIWAQARSARTGADPLALPFAVLHELMAAGVPIEIARETALHAAETRQELLRARLEAEPLPPAVTIDRPRAQAALIVARMLDARPATVARSHANRWVIASALWIVGSFWILYLRGLVLGFAEAW